MGDILVGCALKFDVCMMAGSKGVVIVSGGLIWLSVQVEQCYEQEMYSIFGWGYGQAKGVCSVCVVLDLSEDDLRSISLTLLSIHICIQWQDTVETTGDSQDAGAAGIESG